MIGATEVTRCRACGGRLGAVFCDLGTMPLANAYLDPGADLAAEPRFPLRAVVCDECRLVQLDHVVDAAAIFSDYAYFSSASASWVDHARRFCEAMAGRLGLGPASLVVEVASNDGYLLKNFVAAGIACLGIEPAANVAAVAERSGVPTLVRFLDPDVAEEVLARTGRPADLVVANNVLAHVPEVGGFVAALARLCAPDGVVSVEVPHLVSLVDGVQFDTIYHEHYAYWSLLAAERLFARHGLVPFDVERLPTHGGSVRILASPGERPATASLEALRAEEAARGLGEDGFYRGFDARVGGVLASFRGWLAGERGAGRRVAAYGAAAKGNTFLNAGGIGRDDLLAVADVSPAKMGRLLPGSHVPVVSPGELLAMGPDGILVLPWNIAPEIVRQLRGAGFAGEILTAVPGMRRH